MEVRRLLASVVANKTAAQNVDVLASDFQTKWAASTVRISIAADGAVKVRLVPSSGTAFYFNAGGALTADTVVTEDIALDQGRTWNVQTDDAAGITVTHMVVQEIATV